jgi:hypothetical protein
VWTKQSGCLLSSLGGWHGDWAMRNSHRSPLRDSDPGLGQLPCLLEQKPLLPPSQEYVSSTGPGCKIPTREGHCKKKSSSSHPEQRPSRLPPLAAPQERFGRTLAPGPPVSKLVGSQEGPSALDPWDHVGNPWETLAPAVVACCFHYLKKKKSCDVKFFFHANIVKRNTSWWGVLGIPSWPSPAMSRGPPITELSV